MKGTGMAPKTAWTGLWRPLTASLMLLCVTGCASSGAAPPPARALPCSLGLPTGTPADADAVSIGLARWLARYVEAYRVAC